MSRKWRRIVRATISGAGGELVVEDLRIDFEATRTIGSKQNTGTVTIWNLSVANRGKLGEEFDKVKLEAGYAEAQVGVIFSGSIRSVKTSRQGADTASEIECGDGDEGVNKGAVSRTFPAGTKPREIIDYLRSEMPGVDQGTMVGIDDLPPVSRPYTVYGWAARELDTLGRTYGFYWSLQNGQLEVVRHDMAINDVTLISTETGMIGTPEVTDKGIRVQCLLDPAIAPNRVIDVRSNFLDASSGRDKRASDQGGGLFRVSSVTFTGSNRDTQFYCDIEANRIQGGRVVR